MELVDETLGGIAPGLPLVVAGESGTGRSVLALQLVGAALARGDGAVLLTSEPPVMVLHEASALGLDFDVPLDEGRFVFLGFDHDAADALRRAGAEAFMDALEGAVGDAALVVIDPITALASGLFEEAGMRALVRGIFDRLASARIVFTVEEEQLEQSHGLRRVLLESCGAYLYLAKDERGARTFVVEKTRTSEAPGHPIPFRISHGGATLVDAGSAAPLDLPPPVAKPEKRSSLTTRPAEAPDGERPAVLLVEPDAPKRREMESWLVDRYRVMSVPDATQALAAFIAEQPQVIVLALDAGDAAGYDVLRAVGGAAEWIPILALSTAGRGPAERIRPLVLGAADVVSRHVDRFELLHKLDTLLHLSAPPPHTLDFSQILAKRSGRGESRVLDDVGFRFRMDRVESLGQRFGLASTLLGFESDDPETLEALAELGEHTLRAEDAICVVSETLLLLLVGTSPTQAHLALRRLDRPLRDRCPNGVSLRGGRIEIDRIGDPAGWATLVKSPLSWAELLRDRSDSEPDSGIAGTETV